MTPMKDLREKHYGSRNACSRQVINAEIRAEIPGGEEALEGLELLHKIVRRHGERGADGKATVAKVAYDVLKSVVQAMTIAVRRKYGIGENQP